MTDASITSLRERHLPHALAAVEHELDLAKRMRDACEIDALNKVSLHTLEPAVRETNDARPAWQLVVRAVASRLEQGGDGGPAKELLSSISDYPEVGMEKQLFVLEEVKRYIEGTLSGAVTPNPVSPLQHETAPIVGGCDTENEQSNPPPDKYSPKLVGNKVDDPSNQMKAAELAMIIWGDKSEKCTKKVLRWMKDGKLEANIGTLKDHYVVNSSTLKTLKEACRKT